jgi:hypothetical protein
MLNHDNTFSSETAIALCERCALYVVGDPKQLRKQMRDQAEHAIRGEQAHEVQLLKDELDRVKTQRDTAQEAERVLRADKQAFEEEKRTHARQVDTEAAAKAAELVSAKDQEWQKKLDEAFRQRDEKEELRRLAQAKLEEATRQVAPVVPGARGDSLHQQVANWYRQKYSGDHIVVIDKGVSGGDVLITAQAYGVVADPIMIECKNTKTWTRSWPDTARENARTAGAPYIAIVSYTLPPEFTQAGLGYFGDVVVTEPSRSLPVLAGIRKEALAVARLRAAGEEDVDPARRLMRVFASTEFRNLVTRWYEAVLSGERTVSLYEGYCKKVARRLKNSLTRQRLSIIEFHDTIREVGGSEIPVLPVPLLEFDPDDDDPDDNGGSPALAP